MLQKMFLTYPLQAPFTISYYNIYQIDLCQYLNFIPKVSNQMTSVIFNDIINKPTNKYATKFLYNNSFSLKKDFLNCVRHSITFRGHKLWDEPSDNDEKHVSSRSSRPEVFHKKGVLRNFAKFMGKHLCQNLFFNKVAGLRLWHRCFPVNFAKFLRTPFFIEHLWWLLLQFLQTFFEIN